MDDNPGLGFGSRQRLSSKAWSDQNEEKESSPNITATVKSFCSETTAHGIGNVVKEDSVLWAKIIWLVIVILVLSGGIFHLVYVIDTYLQYPSQETTQLLTKDPKFPHVTICNALPISQNHSAEMRANPTSAFAQYEQMIADMSSQMEQYEQQTGTAVDDILLSPKGLFANIGRGAVVDIGHSLKDLVRGCTYLDEACDMDNHWEHFIDSNYFNCYTFTGGAKLDKSASGPNNGLALVLYMENLVPEFATMNYSYNIYSSLENAFGLRVDIHDKGTLPTPTDTGIDIMPGHSTSISLKANKINKLQHPWGNCTHRDHLENLDQYRYSTAGCYAVCLTQYVYDKCNCVNNYSPTPNTIPNNARLCVYMDNATVTLDDLFRTSNCVFGAHRKFLTSEPTREKCNCKEPCQYRTYDEAVSENIWPASLYQLDTFSEFAIEQENHESLLAYGQMNSAYQNAYDGVTDGSEFKELMYANFARLNIYFKSQTVLERKQTASMTLADLFANIGGTIGLWAGLSVVTVIEVISLVIKITGILVRKCRKAKTSGKVDSNNEQKL